MAQSGLVMSGPEILQTQKVKAADLGIVTRSSIGYVLAIKFSAKTYRFAADSS
jgi:hypothetical protein